MDAGGTPSDSNLSNCPPTVAATQDARRKKMPAEIELNGVLALEKRKDKTNSHQLKSVLAPPPPPQTVSSKRGTDPPPVVIGEGSVTDDEALQAFASALDVACGNEDVPDSTPENAPFDLVLDFMAAVMREEFEEGLKLAKMILKYEPDNETVAEYLPILLELIQLDQEDSDSSCTTDSDGTNSEDSCSSSSGSDTCADGASESSVTETEVIDDGESDVLSVTSESTVATDEYLSEYGEDYELPAPPEDHGYETNATDQRDQEAENE